MAEDERDQRPPEAPDQPRWMRLLEPFRSENAAFRLLLWVAGVFGVLIAVVLIVQALT